MKFTIAPADLKKLLKGVGISNPKPEDTCILSASAAGIFVEFKGDVGGIEGVVLTDGAVKLFAEKFLKLIKTYSGKRPLGFEGGPNGLKVRDFTMPVLEFDPHPKPHADFRTSASGQASAHQVAENTSSSLQREVQFSDKGESNPTRLTIPIPTRLPSRIERCPIVEAAVELRYTSTESWRNLPGLLSPRLRKRYPKEIELPLAQIPESARQKEASFTYHPLLQYEGPEFLVRFGPRVLTLVTRSHCYPGWQRFREELAWLWKETAAAGIVEEGERLSVRYVDFFVEDIFSLLVLGVSIAGHQLTGLEQSYSVVMPWEESTARLVLTNSAILNDGHEARRGSVLDLDVWQRLASENLFADLEEKIEHLHEVNKKLFFGLLKPEFLAALTPVY